MNQAVTATARSRRKSRVSFAPTDMTSLMTDSDFDQFVTDAEMAAIVEVNDDDLQSVCTNNND